MEEITMEEMIVKEMVMTEMMMKEVVMQEMKKEKGRKKSVWDEEEKDVDTDEDRSEDSSIEADLKDGKDNQEKQSQVSQPHLLKDWVSKRFPFLLDVAGDVSILFFTKINSHP